MKFLVARITIFTICMFMALVSKASDYFVSTTGSNSNSGNSIENAFKTIQYAIDESYAGDVIWVADGVYNESVTIKIHGDEDDFIYLRAINKHKAKIITGAGNCFTVDANYIEIDGFELVSTNTYGSGVAPKQGRHHITVRNCYAHDCGQSGIQSYDNDYIVIENNVCAGNGWLMPHAGSGISVFGGFNSDGTEGIHNIVRNNICYNNDNGPSTAMTDGNGIIIDDLKCTQSWHDMNICSLDGYNNVETLVEGNLCFDNGGKGIQVYLSENVTIRNNTCFHNNKRADKEGTWRAEIGLSNSDNIRIVNNIAVCNSDMGYSLSSYNKAYLIAQYGSHKTQNILMSNNLSYNTAMPSSISFDNQVGTTAVKLLNNLFATDPIFVHATIDSTLSNFTLQEDSPAIDAGTLEYGKAKTDIAGNERAMGKAIDLGCYEALGDTLQTGFHYLFMKRNDQLKLYPNPSFNFMNVQLAENHSFIQDISIFNSSGKKIFQTLLYNQSNEVLDVSSLERGRYIVEVSLNEGKKLSNIFNKL